MQRLRGSHHRVGPHSGHRFNATVLQRSDHLIVVCGHAVTVVEDLSNVDEDASWYLLPYQRGQGLPSTFISHIARGVKAAAADPHSLLIFSGGQTRGDAGPRSEGASYWLVAEHFGWFGEGVAVAHRATTEEYAKDSFQNVLFSICRFHEVTGSYPRRLTVVSYSFKQARFQDLHRAALRIPASAFTYLGLEPASPAFDLEKAQAGERSNAAVLFQRDPYGCSDPVLRQKREERDPFRRPPPYAWSCPELASLLRWCSRAIYDGPLPWS